MDITAKFIRENIKLEKGRYPCVKQTVYCCIVSACGTKTAFGTNWGTVKVDECPRGNLPSGEGYEMCKEICKQQFHAETDAIENAMSSSNFELRGATLYLTGHTFMCDDCLYAARCAGIKKAYCLDSGKVYDFYP